MGQAQDQLYCVNCGKNTLHARHQFSGGMGCLLTILTGFLFFPVWFILLCRDALTPWRCQACGLSYSNSAVRRDFALKAAARRPATRPAPRPSVNWSKVGSGITGSVEAVVTGMAKFYRAIGRDTVRAYRSLPEWAAPIVWGLGFTAPLVVLATIGRFMEWW